MQADSKSSFYHDNSINFEIGMRLFFGDPAYHIASGAWDEKYVKRWLNRCIKRIYQDVNKLDTTLRHKEMLELELDKIKRDLSKNGNLWDIIINLFRLVGRLLGYDGVEGLKYSTLTYFQTKEQGFLNALIGGKDWREYEKHKRALFAKRAKMIKELKNGNYSDFEISIILNTTEYQIKKTLKEIKENGQTGK